MHIFWYNPTMKISMVMGVCCLLVPAVSCSGGKSVRSDPPPAVLETGRSDFFQTGIASWYGDDFHGKTTANGEIYDMHKLTAAHQTLPFHALVEVENLANGKKVLVRINDRGPFLKDRIIDLSLLAAQRLDMTEPGTTAVNIRVRRWPGAEKPSASVLAGHDNADCCVQFGAFTVRENADELRLTLEEMFPGLQFRVIVEDDMFKVLSATLPGMDHCQEIIKKLGDYQIQGFIRRP